MFYTLLFYFGANNSVACFAHFAHIYFIVNIFFFSLCVAFLMLAYVVCFARIVLGCRRCRLARFFFFFAVFNSISTTLRNDIRGPIKNVTWCHCFFSFFNAFTHFEMFIWGVWQVAGLSDFEYCMPWSKCLSGFRPDRSVRFDIDSDTFLVDHWFGPAGQCSNPIGEYRGQPWRCEFVARTGHGFNIDIYISTLLFAHK